MRLSLCAFLFFAFIRGYEGRENILDDVILRFYNGATMSEYVDIMLPNATNLMTAPGFNPSAPTIIYAHGFTETVDTDSVQLVISTYLETHQGSNIILIEWSNMGGGQYFSNAAPNTKKVADAVGPEIKKMVLAGLSLSGIHCVGHSLGGHLCGYLGRNLQTFNMKLKRVTALCPAYPGFYPPIYMTHVLGTDAECVDVIHTDAGFFGAPSRTGTLDFWPNAGIAVQPGCPVGATPFTLPARCSHSRSWRFWSESLRNPTAFASVSYNSWTEFVLFSKQKNKPFNYMGLNTNCSMTGNFYLQTNNATQFSKGLPGSIYTM